jgi:hypothetical protein
MGAVVSAGQLRVPRNWRSPNRRKNPDHTILFRVPPARRERTGGCRRTWRAGSSGRAGSPQVADPRLAPNIAPRSSDSGRDARALTRVGTDCNQLQWVPTTTSSLLRQVRRAALMGRFGWARVEKFRRSHGPAPKSAGMNLISAVRHEQWQSRIATPGNR